MKRSKRLSALLLTLLMTLSLAIPAAAVEEENTPEIDTVLSAPATVAEEDLTGSLVLLHTNDVHGGIAGYASVAALRDYYEAKGADVLLLDAGDYIQGDPTVSVSQGETAIEIMNAVGYDAATLGNHEFDYGVQNVKKLIEQADFPIVSSVLLNGEELGVPYAKFDCGKFTVGVFGLTTPHTATSANPAKLEGVTLFNENLFGYAQYCVDQMKADGCNVIVCLGHLGIDASTEGFRSSDLLEKVKGIHIFIDGHSHSTLADVQSFTNENCTVNGTLLVSAGTKLENIGVVVIGPDGSTTASNVPVASLAETLGVTPDERVAQLTADLQEKIDAEYGEVFAKTEVTLDGEKLTNRAQETNLGDLISDAMLWQAGLEGLEVDAAITNGGGIRATIEAGDISKKDVNTVLPFGNTLYIVQLTGSELLEALEASTSCAPDPIGGFPQVAGIEMTLNTGTPYEKGEVYPSSTYSAPAEISRVTIQSVGGGDFDLDETYTIVTNDFLGAGGDTYYAFHASPIGYDLGIPLDETLMDYITAELNGVVTADRYGTPAGRIQTFSYDDVTAHNWFSESVQYVTFNGLMNGTGRGFDPNLELNRATMVTVLYRMAGSPAVCGESAFADVPEGMWYSDAIQWAAETGITTGVEEGMFAPMNLLTREQLATFLYRLAQQEGRDVTVSGEAVLAGFPDVGDLSQYAEDAMTWAVDSELVSGLRGGLLSPGWAATRAQFATILMRYIESAA